MYNLGELHGIADLRRSRHIELLPHTVGRVTSAPGAPADGSGSVGLDAKMGLTTDFTLDATVNPDFGQVEADPSVVNLTAYETFFEEKRPFFVEGKRILTFGLEPTTIAGDSADAGEDTLFYSRRIGHAPSYAPPLAAGETVVSPESTSILSAVKVTGKTRNGLSVGVLQSLTGDEHARLSGFGTERRQRVEPQASYVAARVQKDWDKGNTILGGMFTSADRAAGDPALAFLPRHAITGGVDVVRFFSNRSYVLEAKGTFSRVAGDREALVAVQNDPVHYFQRPDAAHLGVNRAATSLTGHGGTVRVARYGNSKWRASNTLRWMSPGLELNDLGFLRQADLIVDETAAGFEQTAPSGVFRSYGVNAARSDSWDFAGLHTDGATSFEVRAQLANKWTASAATHVIDTTVDTRLLRGGPAFAREPFLSTSVTGSTDPSRRAVVTLGAHRHSGGDGALREAELSSGLRLRVSRAFSLSAEFSNERATDDVQYVDTVQAGSDTRYLLGRLHQRTSSVVIRADLHLTPDLSVQYYGSPFVSTGRYDAFKRATSTRAAAYTDRFHIFDRAELQYDPEANRYTASDGAGTYELANPDFSVREFRSNLVTRWEFRPGSAAYLVWSQARSGAGPSAGSVADGFRALRREPATNVVLVKLSYWLPF
jgi:hypothetical protein